MKYLKRLAHRLFRTCRYDFLRYTSDNFVSLRRAKILHAQNVDLVLDIGASEGTYALELREVGYSGRIISFEPLSQSFFFLQQCSESDPLWDCENLAIGDSDSTTEINVSRHKTSSSILPITEKHVNAMPSSATIAKEKVEVVSLDSLLGRIINPNDRIYLKADVQGYEKHVLQGAIQTLKQIRVIELELSLIQLYEGSPILSEMLEYIDKLDYELVSIGHVFSDPKTGHMLQADGIFVKKCRASTIETSGSETDVVLVPKKY